MKVVVQMNPVAKGRARTCLKGSYIHSYTPKKTADAEHEIWQALCEQCGIHAGSCYFAKGTPLKVRINFYIAIPKSKSKKRIYPITRPDIDNYVKLVLDAMGYQETVFFNDSQIVELHATKQYGEPARIEIEIKEEDNG